MGRRRIGHKSPKSPPMFSRDTEPLDFYEDDVTNDNQDTAYQTIQPEVEGWENCGLVREKGAEQILCEEEPWQ